MSCFMGSSKFEVCGEAASSDEALDLINREKPDVAIVDLSLQDADGLGLVETIHTIYPDIKIIVFSMYDEKLYAERALRAGAQGYVMKNAETKEVARAVEAVVQGEMYLSSSMTTRMLSKMSGRRVQNENKQVSDLTDRELAIFKMLGEGYTVDEVAERLHLSPITVKHYRRSSREKLGAKTNAELLYFAVEWVHSQAAS